MNEKEDDDGKEERGRKEGATYIYRPRLQVDVESGGPSVYIFGLPF